jgi:hypothetical protein
MGIWAKLLGSDSVVEKSVDGIYNGLDKLVYTDEEKKDNHKAFLQLYEPFKVAQRYLAMTFSIPFAILHVGAFSIRLAFWDNEVLQQSIKTIQADMNTSLGMIVLAIVGFYFTGGAIEGAAKAWKRDAK